jgi:hypothetical protein
LKKIKLKNKKEIIKKEEEKTIQYETQTIQISLTLSRTITL